ncbi:amino acid adenylation domain-containing protein [Streptantibioticus parmotrematis]|uniref:non-ribosomal peptide synthetase n=1 Tax=Streptantibioticus parmotrematis TaxID=2873249 RepID=UPI0033DF6F23
MNGPDDTRRPVVAPASFAQRRLWFLDHFASGNNAYNLVSALRLRGPLDLTALRGSLQRVVDRHEALRTTFRAEAGEPYQCVAAAMELALPVTDLTGLPEEGRTAHASALVEAETLREFDLAEGPLIRTTLLRLADDDHVLAVVCHHTVCDGWSMGRFHGELTACYAALRVGGEPELPPLPSRFSDHALRERERDASEGFRDALAAVRDRLTGAPALLDLPTTYTRPAVQGFEGATHDMPLSPQTWQAVLGTSRRHRVTPFMTLLSVYAVLLSRLSGTDDLVIGSPSAGRADPAVAPLIGMFVNTLPLRVDLSGDPSFADLLLRVRGVALAAFRHQDVPLERVVTELGLDRATSHDPLFQTMFALQQPLTLPELDGLTAEIFPVRPPTTFTDLWLEIRPHGEGAVCTFRYRTELFDDATVRRIARQFHNLLDSALSSADAPVSRLDLLDEAETHTLLREWSTTGDAYPWDGPVHEAIARQAERTPDATAVVFRDTRISYAGLVHATEHVARRLADEGAGPRTVVALCLARGVELLPSILAVLRTGAAYLPLSPEDPPGRLVRLLHDAGATHVLTTSDVAPALADAGVPVIEVDALTDDDTLFAGHTARGAVDGGTAAPAEVSPDDLAYVIYTSGSTGRPKAVGVPHQGLANRVHHLRHTPGLAASDRVLHKTPYTFDVSVWELLAPLTVGATLVVAEPGGHRDPAYLVDLIEREAVTTAHFVPPMLEAFLGEHDLERCRSLRRVMCSGQALSAALRDRTLSRLDVRLYNFYGPTEASIEVTEWECVPRTPASGGVESPGAVDDGRVPIGRPLPGVEVYVLDTDLRPVPIGVPGELYLGGPQLARGYLTRPDLTADRFIPHPHTTTPGQRLYRTGDLARWNTNTTLDYLGRNDHQLKIRGFRIEPGEIENTLRDHPTIHDAITTTTTTTDQSEPTLTAYVTLAEGAADPDEVVEAIRDHLRDQLPRYMVPTHVIVLPAFPLGASGKVDRAALPAPEAHSAADRGGAPRDEVERELAAIWAQVLGRPEPGVEEDFFEAGGDSLRSIQVVHRAREAGWTLTVSDVFHHPTIAELAALLRPQARTAAASGGPR